MSGTDVRSSFKPSPNRNNITNNNMDDNRNKCIEFKKLYKNKLLLLLIITYNLRFLASDVRLLSAVDDL